MSQNQSGLIQKMAKENPVQKLQNMSDAELLSYWNQAKAQGYSLNQLKTLARAQGANSSDIAQFEKRIKNLKEPKETTEPTLVEDNLTSIFGISDPINQDLQDEGGPAYVLPIFGMDFFKSNTANSGSSPQLNVATPASYQLGPGDEIMISVWGGSENEYQATINTGGYIKLDRIAPIYLSGYSISSAKKRIGNALSKIYSGIKSSKESYQKVFFDISLSQSRSIVLNIVGNVRNPGTYTLSSMISLINALYAAGGPNENGSFRNIKILRNGKTYKTVDLYDYFVKGVYPSLTLNDQDVILIPTYSKRVFVNGEFKKAGIYELKEKETLNDLLFFSGGFSSFAYKNTLFVESVVGINKSIQSFNLENYGTSIVQDGDIVTAKAVSDKFLNRVSIDGAVYLPGEYSFENNPNLKTLLSSAQGLKDDALLTKAVLFRYNDGKENQILSIDLNSVLSEKKKIILQTNDRVTIFSKLLIEEESSVEIRGEVNNPMKNEFFDGMTVADLILLADGIKKEGDSYSIDIYRKTYDKSRKTPFKSISTGLNSDFTSADLESNLFLEADDLVVVRSKEGSTSGEFVTINGLIKKPGIYSILNNKYSLFDLLNDSGGILEEGALNGVKIKRVNRSKEQIEDALKSSDSLGFEIAKVEEYIEFGVDIAQLYKTDGKDLRYNVILKGGDVIEVPKVDNTIEIIGEVQQPTVINFKKGITGSQAINQAGGVTDLAKKSGAFIVYQNGNVASFKRFLLFSTSPKLEPGCKIVVPRKLPNPNKTSLTEIIGLTSTLATLTVLLRTL